MNFAARTTAFLPGPKLVGRPWVSLVVRLMLIALLAFDQVSAPLHHHQHDAGPDGIVLHVAPAVDSFIEHSVGQTHEPATSHEVAAFKRKSECPSRPGGDMLPVAAFTSLFASMLSTAHAATVSWVLEIRDPVLAHRNLPPDGHAPPLHV